jgi:hypothetical protein
MGFKLGSERRDFKSSENVDLGSKGSFNPNNIEIVKTPLEKGTIAEARNDGSIAINSNAKISKSMLKRTIKHEMKHMKDMADGKANYGENWVMWEGKIYIRHKVDGEMVIDGPKGRWPEGHPEHPWEQEAYAAEDKPMSDLET